MTPTAERALILKIGNPKIFILDLIDVVLGVPDITEAALDAFDCRLVEMESCVTWMAYVPYLLKHKRPKLFDALCARQTPSGFDQAALFEAGYGGAEIEYRLCAQLYEIYADNAQPLRRSIVEALVEHGGVKSLEMLEVIKFEIAPDLKSKTVVVNAFNQAGADDEYIDVKKLLYVTLARSLGNFSERVELAITTISKRLSTPSTAPQTEVKSVLPPSDLIEAIPVNQTTVVPHSRMGKVEFYLSKAEKFKDSDPPESLNNARKSAEAICKDLLDESTWKATSTAQGAKPGEAYVQLEDMLSDLRRRKVIPAHIDKYLSSLQSFGNLASHDQEIDPEHINSSMAASILLQVRSVVSWFKMVDLSEKPNGEK